MMCDHVLTDMNAVFPYLRFHHQRVRDKASMDESSGRGHREKKPSEKVKEQVTGKADRIEDEKTVILPTYIAPNDPKFFQEQKEVPKIYDHSKIGPHGEKTDFYALGTQYEPVSFIKRSWKLTDVVSRAKRNVTT